MTTSTNSGDQQKHTISRFSPILQKAVIVYGKSHIRVMPVEAYERLKQRNSAVNKWRKKNLAGKDIACSACQWQIPEVFRLHARCKGQLSFLSVHHLLPYSEGGSEDDTNLIALCPTCHEIADYLPRIISLPVDESLKDCIINHLKLIATDPDEWTYQYNRWNLNMKRRAVESLQGEKQKIHQPFYVEIAQTFL